MKLAYSPCNSKLLDVNGDGVYDLLYYPEGGANAKYFHDNWKLYIGVSSQIKY